MIVVEKYSFKDGQRYVDKVEYSDVEEFERDIVLERIAGTHIGHKIYSTTLVDYNSKTQQQRDTMDCEAWFDKEAFIRGNSIIKDLHKRLAARGVIK